MPVVDQGTQVSVSVVLPYASTQCMFFPMQFFFIFFFMHVCVLFSHMVMQHTLVDTWFQYCAVDGMEY